ncbi:pyrophosphatase PpaX [Clostridium swellfunianum]|uniref:pyrophosphatase PpaX n=1 Tax=Clostridium swellfunianum TaxID=1367462 RepID=UPI0020309840|nr:pyrophosphatase PpaX [Clostridium swellfunianum]MCM0650545.1 pyrophosphatase PpaX [Clostridium swellfunianum]
MIKAILFDLDGTLIDTNDLIIQSFKHTFKRHLNKEVPESEIVMNFGEPLLATLQKYDNENADILIQTYRSYNEAIHDELTKEIVGVKETLRELKTLGIKIGVVTSKRRALAERGLKLFNLYELMEVIITPEDTEKHKPDAEPMLKACELLGVLPEEALMVGDSHYDILCGKNAGSKACLVKYTALPVDKIMEHKPHYAVDDIKEVLQIVREENFKKA